MKKGINTNIFKKDRIIAPNAENSVKIREILKIPNKEKILMVLDDSFFINQKQLVVFTDKNIYWNINNAILELKVENTRTKLRGEASIGNKSLNNASIFSRNIKDILVIYIINENVQIIIPFSNFNNESSLTLLFYEHIIKYAGRYKPDNNANEKIFSSISQSNEIVSISMVSIIFNVMSYLMASLFLINIIFGFFIVNNEIAIYTILMMKASGLLFGNRKSLYFYLFMIIFTPLMFYRISNFEPLGYETLLYIVYSILFLIFGIFDFDKIFKYLVFISAIASIIYMIRQIIF